MSFWNNPSASFEQLGKDPWHSMQNFATTGLVPLIPYIGGIVGGIYGGPAGAAAGGAAGQEGVDYFGGNSQARTGKGIMSSLFGGAGKGMLASGGYNSMGGMDGIQGLFGGGGGTEINPATNLPWSDTGSGYAGNGGQITPADTGSSSGFNLGDITKYGSKLANLLGNNSGSSNNTSVGNSMGKTAQSPILNAIPQPPVQPAFYPSKQDAPIQDTKNLELIALIDALRGQNG